jgi:uncharacterized protein (DUF1015 family)
VANVAPFRGLRYDLSVVGDLATVTAPPYDVIPPDALERFETASPYNVVRLILARDVAGGDKYTRAAQTLETWRRDGILVRDLRKGITVYEQRFLVGGRERVQRGVLAAVDLEADGSSVLPHERTMAAPVEDRLKLVRATRANLSPIFAVTSGGDDGAREVVTRATEQAPHADFATGDDGVSNRVWIVDDASEIETLRRSIAEASVVIADGHHRYRTALEYQAERRAAGDGAGPWDAMLFYLVDASWCGPALLPIHRVLDLPAADVLAALGDTFEIEPASERDPEALAAELERRRPAGRSYALLGPKGAWWLTVADKAAEADALPADRSAEWRDLDVAVLEWLVFRHLLGGASAEHVHTATEAAEAIAQGRAGSAVLLAPPPFESVRAVAEAGEAMPPKSTFFIPKPRTGIVIRELNAGRD